MDAISLYPSITVEKASEIVREGVIESKIRFEGLDVVEIGKFLRKNLNNEEHHDKGFIYMVPTKKKKKSKKKKDNKPANNDESARNT